MYCKQEKPQKKIQRKNKDSKIPTSYRIYLYCRDDKFKYYIDIYKEDDKDKSASESINKIKKMVGERITKLNKGISKRSEKIRVARFKYNNEVIVVAMKIRNNKDRGGDDTC